MARSLVVLCLCCVVYGDEAAPKARTELSQKTAAPGSAEEPPSADIRDVLLLLDEAPLHIRFHVSLGRRALSAVRAAYIGRLIATLDTDGDGKLSSEEVARSPLLMTRRRGKPLPFADPPSRTDR